MSIEEDGLLLSFSKERHTMRYNYAQCGKGRTENVVVDIKRCCREVGEGVKQYAMTGIDDFLMSLRDECTLNSSIRWENVINELEQTSISKILKHYPSYGHKVYYDVPVEGHLIVSDDKTDQSRAREVTNIGRRENWLLWQGIYYDPDLIYAHTHAMHPDYMKKLKVICTRISPAPIFLDTSIVELRYSIAASTKKANKHVNINHTHYHISGAGWKQTGHDRHLDIDLGRYQIVTHIGVAGKFPITKPFPQEAPSASSRWKNKYTLSNKRRKIRKRRQCVEVVVETGGETVSYTTSVRISYFDIQNRNWLEIGIFPTNIDATTEVLIDFTKIIKTGIQTRLLRIEPISCYNQPVFRCAIYGRNTISKYKNNTTDQPEIVTYCVNYPVTTTKIAESKYTRSYRYDRYYHYRTCGIKIDQMMRKEIELSVMEVFYYENSKKEKNIDDITNYEDYNPINKSSSNEIKCDSNEVIIESILMEMTNDFILTDTAWPSLQEIYSTRSDSSVTVFIDNLSDESSYILVYDEKEKQEDSFDDWDVI